jgi:choice-of-anchor A domain-containing protein
VNALTISGCSSCNINNGGSVNFITSNSGTYNFNGGGSLKQNMPMFMMSDFTTPLNALQTQLSALTANSTVTGNLAFNVTPHNGVAVFDISASELETANSNITFTNETSATTIIINVTGGNFTENGGTNFNGDTYLAEHAIWNFGSASSVSVKQWFGAVLAGDATVSNSSPINGFLYAENFAGQGELHDFPFQGTLPGTVPEASTWAMMAIGFAGLGFLGLRRRTAVAA